jgi:hypothetical protein
VGSGLAAKGGGELKGFAIAGSDNRFVWADAEIHGDTVTVSSAQVSRPTQVRYSYAGNPIGNLVNREGLPASPFQTEGPQLIPTGLFTAAPARFSGLGGAWAERTPLLLFPGRFDALGRVAPGPSPRDRRGVDMLRSPAGDGPAREGSMP